MNRYLEDSFFNKINDIEERYRSSIRTGTLCEPESLLSKRKYSVNDIPALLSVKDRQLLSAFLYKAGSVRDMRFGKKINLYSPVYVSDLCENECAYCGFNAGNKRPRVVLKPEEVLRESQYLKGKNISHILLVGGESDNTPVEYYSEVIDLLRPVFDSISIEVAPLTADEYGILYKKGLDGVTVYQETYGREEYSKYHLLGNKRDYRYRIETADRASKASLHHVTIGILLGLSPHIKDLFYLACHLEYLMNKYWKTQFAVSFPRLNSEGIDFIPSYPVKDIDFTKIISVFRLVFPDCPIYLSTRETPFIRDNMLDYGISHISVESRTCPGSYTGIYDTEQQFGVSDKRPVEEIVNVIRDHGLNPVFKDWDRNFMEVSGENKA